MSFNAEWRSILRMAFAIRSTLAACAVIGWSTTSLACARPEPFAIEDIRGADAVFAGRLINYARIDRDRPTMPGTYGLLTVEVGDVIKGSVPRRVELAWFNSTFGIPEEWPTAVPLLIAAFRVDDDMPGPTWRVLESPCAPAFVLDDTPENRANVQKVLTGEDIPPRDYFALQQAEVSRKQAEAQRVPVNAETDTSTLFWVSAVLAGLVLAGWLLARRKG